MQIKSEELASHLKTKLLPIYLVSGDETLLVEEACDAIIAAARNEGFTERSIHHAEGSYKWHELSHDSSSLSLFAEKKILDVRVPGKKFDREASDSLRAWIEDNAAGGETMMLIRTIRLEPRQRSSAWFKAIDKAGAVSLIWPLSHKQLPRWLNQRMREQGLTADSDAVQYLCDKVEGNLLAASQEIHKLVLQDLPSPISAEAMAASLEDSSRFTSFDLIDAMMEGDRPRVVHILDVLRQEGAALFAILGALTAQMRRLGDSQRLPPARQRIVQDFARRIKDPLPVLAECALVDQQGKGQKPGDPWISLEKMLLRLAGARKVTLASQDYARLVSR
ncbi:MAG: DNA polymerase III subunit delta [Pseudomonadales bacterium]|nr:DNA polymerase III subunit delta [Pseudomonadales bacterium]